ncbi:efflux RND transporter periplasmic adaptor subunit [bacterium endosymbiont of Escarpia laminata]|nr:MAG: efflux RND transporter periplasmic adaptor subunit [bacterium endosymbiont of Escarpia laminata]
MPHTKPLLISILACIFSFGPLTVQADQAYQIMKVKRELIPLTIDIAGTVAARKTVQLTAQIPGRIKRIAGQEGDRFSRGNELISIDDSALRAKLDAAVAQRDAALASMRNANVQLYREVRSPQSTAGSAAPGGMGMPSMMDQAFTNPMQNMMGMRNRGAERHSDVVNRQTQVAQANTQYKQAEAQIKEIQASLRDARSIAPFNGVIESVNVEVGDTVQPGQQLLVYSETSGFQVLTDVPVRLRPGLSEGMSLEVRLDGADPVIYARISRIFPVADRTQHTVHFELDLPGNTVTTVGQYAEVSVPDLSTRQNSNLVIPNSAVRKKGGLPLVFVVDAKGFTKLRVVRLGEAANAGNTVVLSGIREGDLLINNPPPGLRAGTQVMAPAESAQAPNNNQ